MKLRIQITYPSAMGPTIVQADRIRGLCLTYSEAATLLVDGNVIQFSTTRTFDAVLADLQSEEMAEDAVFIVSILEL